MRMWIASFIAVASVVSFAQSPTYDVLLVGGRLVDGGHGSVPRVRVHPVRRVTGPRQPVSLAKVGGRL